MVNTTSGELTDVAIEASVWDLEGTCAYYKVFDKLTLPCKKTLPISPMKYPKSENAEPVYFLLLKLYKMSDNQILSRNFYWLHLPGGSYKLLEAYKKRKVSLNITSVTFIKGSSYEMNMFVENTSKKPDSRSLLYNNNVSGEHGKNDSGLLQKMLGIFPGTSTAPRVTEINGTDAGVAFFLHFSVHDSKKDEKNGEDTRILPVHYSDNYFSLVPGEVMKVTLNFEVPSGITPRIMIHGWNYEGVHIVS